MTFYKTALSCRNPGTSVLSAHLWAAELGRGERGVWTQHRAKALQGAAHGIGATGSVNKELACDVSLQTLCRINYGGRTLSNTSLKNIFQHKCVFKSPQGVQ